MKKYLILLFLITSFSQAQTKAFEGAEGFGKYTVGGRGGTVYKVTNLNDSGAGSLRAACEASGARVVVFEVGGVIDLQTPISITNPNISIFGQTAVGDGIMLVNSVGNVSRLMHIDTNQVIVQFLTFRRSEGNTGYNFGDCLYLEAGNDIIIDHCSFSWSSDGNMDIANYDYNLNNRVTDNVTVQYCIFTNSYGGSNKSMLITGSPPNVSVFRCAFINSNSRNPAMSSDDGYHYTFDSRFELVNNLWYDCVNGATCGNVSNANKYYLNFVNNWRKAANGAIHTRRLLRIGDGSDTNAERAYVSGNVDESLIASGIEADPEWRMVQYGSGSGNASNPVPAIMRESTRVNTPILTEGITLWTGAEVRTNLPAVVGNYLFRDAEDTRALNDLENNTSTYNNATNTFPTYNNGTALTDTSGDGMPDSWKTTKGLNINTDDSAYIWGSGYVGVEEYTNEFIFGGEISNNDTNTFNVISIRKKIISKRSIKRKLIKI